MPTTQKVSTETILESLAAHPRLTAPELVEVLGIGRSTAAKHLATLEVAGTARREPGGRDGGRRMADRWSATAPVAEAPRLPTTPHPTIPSRPTDRLARGELGALVHDYLAERPGEAFGQSVGKALGRSRGAVFNALAPLAAPGEAELVGDKPAATGSPSASSGPDPVPRSYPRPRTPRVHYPTCGVVASGADPAPVARARREISFGGLVGSPRGVPHLRSVPRGADVHERL